MQVYSVPRAFDWEKMLNAGRKHFKTLFLDNFHIICRREGFQTSKDIHTFCYKETFRQTKNRNKPPYGTL